MRRESRGVVGLLTVLGLGLVAATVPLWLGERLFCGDSDDIYCGIYWLVLGFLGLLVAGAIGAALGEGWAGLAMGLVGVTLGTYIALALESAARQPYHSFTWELLLNWAASEVAAFGIGYLVVWALRRGAMATADARRDAARNTGANDKDA